MTIGVFNLADDCRHSNQLLMNTTYQPISAVNHTFFPFPLLLFAARAKKPFNVDFFAALNSFDDFLQQSYLCLGFPAEIKDVVPQRNQLYCI